MSIPLVSVVVPVYNGERFIAECLDFLGRQTYRPLEILVVDDGSSDRSALIAEQHPIHPIVIRTPHRNLPSARNEGIRAAAGEIIGLCDADDLWVPDKLQRQMKIFSDHREVGLVFSAYSTIGSDPDRSKQRRATGAELRFNSGDQFAILTQKNIIAPSSALVRASLLDRIGLFDDTLDSCEDWELWLRIAKAKIRMCRIGRPLLLYRKHATNMSGKLDIMHRSRLRVLEKTFDGIPMTPRLKRLKDKAMARAFFEAANGYYSSGDRDRFREYYQEARRHGHALLSSKAFRRHLKELFGVTRS